MEKLTREEVLHVAHLARINVSEEEIEKYQTDLATMINEVDKIKDLNDFDEDMIYTPSSNVTELIKKDYILSNNDLLKNVPKKKGNFIEVPVMLNEE